MRYAKDAIKYGIETLNVTPKELFNLIESSKGYTGDDYKRWLAARIIEVCEKDGVGFSLLLAKWFNIIQSMIEEYSDDSIKPEFDEYIRSQFVGKVYTVGFDTVESDEPLSSDTEEFDESIEDPEQFLNGSGEADGEDGEQKFSRYGVSVDHVKWLEGRDLAWNTEFINGKLEKGMTDCLENEVPFTLFWRFAGKESLTKSCDLFVDAKQAGVSVKDNNGLYLFRLCSMVNALESMSIRCRMRVVLFVGTDFLYNEDNQPVIKHFLDFFHYTGFVVNSKDLYSGSYTSEDYAILVCESRRAEEKVQRGIVLGRAEVENGNVVVSEEKKRYSDGGQMLRYLCSKAPETNCNVVSLSRGLEVLGACRGVKGALGYVCRGNTDRAAIISSYPLEGTDYFAITEDNILEVIAYYGIAKSMLYFGYSDNIPELISGHPEYLNLVYNCLPVFLFDPDTLLCDVGPVKGKMLKNKLAVGTPVVDRLFAEGEVYFGYEAKELIDVCKGYMEYMSEGSGKTFDAMRKEADNAELNKLYIRKLNKCKDYISSLYRQMGGSL